MSNNSRICAARRTIIVRPKFRLMRYNDRPIERRVAMKLRVSTLLLFGGTAAALSFSSLPAKETPSTEATQKLAQALQGRTPGKPVNCIANLRGGAQMSVIDDTTILFREGNTVYVQKPEGGCPSRQWPLCAGQAPGRRFAILRGRHRRGRRPRVRLLCGKLRVWPIHALSEGKLTRSGKRAPYRPGPKLARHCVITAQGEAP